MGGRLRLGMLLLWACNAEQPAVTDSESDPVFSSTDTEVQHSASASASDTESATDSAVDTGFLCDTRLTPGDEVDTDADCATSETFPWEPEVLWQVSSFSSDTSHDIVRVTPVVGRLLDTDGDGVLDDEDHPIVVLSADDGAGSSTKGVLRLLDGSDGTELIALDGFEVGDASYRVAQQAGVALGDVDGDGWPELVTVVVDEANDTAHLAAVAQDGTALWVATELSLSQTRGYPSVADLDADGDAEVVYGNHWVSGTDGTWLASGSEGAGMEIGNIPISVPVDLDGDGDLEVLAGNAVYDHNGAAVCATGDDDGFPATADLNADGVPEVVVTGRGQVRVYSDDCSEILSWEVTGGSRGGPAALGDISGDGRAEIVLVIADGIEAYTRSGTLLWSHIIGDGSGRTAPTLFDFDGDGIQEIVHADEGALRVFSGKGVELFVDGDHDSATSVESVAIADVDGDGDAELVVADSGYSSFGRQTGVTVWHGGEMPFPEARPIFSQHAWFDVHIENDGTVATDSHYSGHNSFRAVLAQGGHPEALPNGALLGGGTCEADCTRGRLVVRVHVSNDGGSDLPAGTPVAAYAVRGATGELLDVLELPEQVPPGESSDSLVFVFDAAAMSDADLRVRVDDDGTLQGLVEECHEDDNILTLEGPWCDDS